MNKKVLILSTSPRKGSNSHALAEAFGKGAREAGNPVEILSLAGQSLAFCRGCLACQNTHRCVIRDFGDEIARKMRDADVLVFATPVYYYGMSGQMKTMLDRANPLYGTDYAFRDIYLLCAAAEDEPATPEGTIHGLEGWIACFPETRLAGTVFAGGVNAPGEIAGHSALEKAYEMGKSI